MPPKQTLSVEATSAEEQQGILFVAAFCGLQNALTVQKGTELQLVTSEGQTYTSYTSVCRYLASVSSKSQQLIGSTALDRAKVPSATRTNTTLVPVGMFKYSTRSPLFQVQDWLSFRNSELSGLSEQQLLKVCDPDALSDLASILVSSSYLWQVNDRLQTKVYLAGPTVTLADLVLFSTLHRALVRTLPDTTGQKCFGFCSGVRDCAINVSLLACRSISHVLKSLSGIQTCSAGLTFCSTLSMWTASTQS